MNCKEENESPSDFQNLLCQSLIMPIIFTIFND